jgi:glycosyltransferase involved in cell wall biosynthesis
MKLLVVSHKVCWPNGASPTGYATDGGFAFQMSALSELFDETRVIIPCEKSVSKVGENPIAGKNVRVVAINSPRGTGLVRKLAMLPWMARCGDVLFREIRRADAVHTPIPGDIGTIGMILALVLRKPLFVRHCGNWLVQRTAAEHFWKWFMERNAGGRNVMLATGGSSSALPSKRNQNIRWIFSTSLTDSELSTAPSAREYAESLRLIIVCRQEKEKGTGNLIESLPALVRQFPTLMLDVVGDGSGLDQFQKLAERVGVSNHVVFHGKVDHEGVIRLLRQASIFCYPTRASEGFPKVVLEAMACGLPIITTRVSVLPELMKRGGGVLIDDATPDSITRAVEMLVRDRERYGIMSANALKTARQYSLEKWRDTIGDLLKSTWARPLSS